MTSLLNAWLSHIYYNKLVPYKRNCDNINGNILMKKKETTIYAVGILKPVVTMKMVLEGQGWWKRKMLMRLEGWHS